MLFRLLSLFVTTALKTFYRVRVVSPIHDFSGPVMFVGNHPNSIVDPAMMFLVTKRPITFLAKEPLFRVPLFGWLLRALGALPVYRKQDNPSLMAQNEGTLAAASQALLDERAITIFPEGRSHSEPQLSDIKTGCARIARHVATAGKALRVIPVGLTYAQKHRVRSEVLIEVGEAILVEAVPFDAPEKEWVRALTEKIESGLKAVTLNLETWEDMELIQTANVLFSLRNGYAEEDAERLRLFAQGASLMRAADAEYFDALKDDILSFRARAEVLSDGGDLKAGRRARRARALLVLRSVAAMVLGFPFFALGLVLLSVPFVVLRALALLAPVAEDRVATLKLTVGVLVLPLWWTALAVGAWATLGTWGLVLTLLFSGPLTLFTRYFWERRRVAFNDIAAFWKLGSEERLREHLLLERERLQEEIARQVAIFSPRLGVSTIEEV